MPTDCNCPCHEDERSTVAFAEKMLDAAERAGVDLWDLEQCRRRVEADLVKLDRACRRRGRLWSRRRRELKRAVELGVNMLATAFKEMATLVPRETQHGRG